MASSINDQIFLLDNEGKEHSIQISGLDVACREGHELTVIWSNEELKNSVSHLYFLVYNHTIEKEFLNESLIDVHLSFIPYKSPPSRGLMWTIGIIAGAIVLYWFKESSYLDYLTGSYIILGLFFLIPMIIRFVERPRPLYNKWRLGEKTKKFIFELRKFCEEGKYKLSPFD